MLSVTSNFFSGTLTLNLTAADAVALSAVGGNVQLTINGISGFNPDSGVQSAAGVKSIIITATDNFDNTIDLTSINQTDYSSLVSINLDGGDGNDSYIINQNTLPSAASVIIADSGGSGTDSLVSQSTGVGPETIGITASTLSRSGSPLVSYSG
ncbi:MAG TPA: hypothetical protein VFE46_08140, partial [Pirellulales bacterium]|nr:hypothetical protein [Pirellulales bacterium]